MEFNLFIFVERKFNLSTKLQTFSNLKLQENGHNLLQKKEVNLKVLTNVFI